MRGHGGGRRKIGRARITGCVSRRQWSELDALVETTYAEFGRLDIVVNNAGMSPLYPALDEIPEETRTQVYNPELTDPAQPLAESVYRNWKSPRKPPWTIRYASTYAGNTWRKRAMKRLLGEVLPK